ncbi:MAG: hypothetical protein ACFFAH_14620 [Promethearchaeota archaeon]
MGKLLTDSKRLNIAIILSFIIYFQLIIVGIFYASLGTFMPYHIAFTGKTESDVNSYSSELMTLISILIRLLGFCNITIGIMGLFILYFAFRKREGWTWILGLITGCIGYIPNLILTYTVLGLGLMYILTIISFILCIKALGISYKEFFK